MLTRIVAIGTTSLALTTSASAQSFVNWESPHVHPVDLTPDGARLVVVNTADAQLEVFDVSPAGLSPAGAVPVGLDPVTARARTNDEVWVVNHVSDSISVVDLTTMNVRATVHTGDEPTDVVFAGTPQRAFVCVSQLNEVRVFDPFDLGAAPTILPIEGEDPRALATDGSLVYALVHEAGNGTTVIGEEVVSSNLNPYSGNPNPPPNSGNDFDPPIDGGLPTPPEASLILRRSPTGEWLDINGEDWSAAVSWDLHMHDVAVIDAGTLSIDYATGFMNANMAAAMTPTGELVVVGTQALNDVRFEPNLNGIFLLVQGAVLDWPAPEPTVLADLNPHLDYTTATVSQRTRDESIGDPRAVAVDGTGRIFIAGMGSNNVVVHDASLTRLDRVEVGEGPTGLMLDGDRLYVLNRFEASISTIDTTSMTETDRVFMHDATPSEIRLGRPFLYDTHRTSGLGHVSCGSCHIDARMDQVAWDLGDPQGEVKPFNQVCNFGLGGCEDWHPMKGPMTTQTLVGIAGTEPFHWRGDREDLAAFNGAFESLLGDDTQLTNEEMDAFTAFVATLTPPPNPFRHIDGSLPTSVPGSGNAVVGEVLFNTAGLDGVECVTCHAFPSGTNGELTSAPLLGAAQSMKIPSFETCMRRPASIKRPTRTTEALVSCMTATSTHCSTSSSSRASSSTAALQVISSARTSSRS